MELLCVICIGQNVVFIETLDLFMCSWEEVLVDSLALRCLSSVFFAVLIYSKIPQLKVCIVFKPLELIPI